MNISVIGVGYVGLVTAAMLAKLNHNVICIDINKEKVDKINNKESPLYEPGLNELLQEVVGKNLKASTDLKDAILNTEISFISVDTPSRKEGEIYTYSLKKVSEQIGNVLKEKKDYHLIVLKSTVIPGTTEDIVIPIVEENSGKKVIKDFGIIMSPEFLREGSALQDSLNPDRIVIGVKDNDKKSLEILKSIYKNFNCPILETNLEEAEMIKYASNTFLATKLSFINEIGNICKKLSVNTNTVAKGMGLDKRIGPHFLKAGIGFGGSCFPKDLNALIYKATELGFNPRLLRATLEVNKEQPFRIIELMDKHNTLKNKKVGILGLTFKGETDDIRESSALEVIKALLLEDVELFIHDPVAMHKVKTIFPHLNYKDKAQEVVDSSDLVLILSEWPEFTKLDYKDKLVIDGKNVFGNGDKKPKNYEGICW